MLNNLRVVELGQVLSAPYAAMILADLGAEVIKVEKPPKGDEARSMGQAFRNDASMTFNDVNRNKKSVVLDLKSEAGRAGLFRLLETTDVLIHNLRPGDAQRLKLEGATLRARFPRLVYCEMGAFGHTGPRRLEPGYEPLLQAFSGLISTNGAAGGPPARVSPSIVDQGTGMWAVIGILSALNARQQSGAGAMVNVSLLETAIGWLAPRINEYVNQKRPVERYGTAHPNLVPYQTFQAKDGLVMICAGNDRLFAQLAQALDRAAWIGDERYVTNRARLKHRAELVAEIEAVLGRQDRDFWIGRIAALGVPVTPVNTVPEMLADAQTQALEIVRPVGDHGFVLTGLPLSLNGERPPADRPSPDLGADTTDLLGTCP